MRQAQAGCARHLLARVQPAECAYELGRCHVRQATRVRVVADGWVIAAKHVDITDVEGVGADEV